MTRPALLALALALTACGSADQPGHPKRSAIDSAGSA